MFDGGYLTLATVRSVRVRMHATVPLLAILVSGLRFAPGAWLGALLVVLVHEAGHALLARRLGKRVLEIALHGAGGHCAYVGEVSAWDRSIIATGGVLAQAALGLLALVASWLLPRGPFVDDLFAVLLWTNAMIALLNLVPIPPLDGAEIAKLPKLIRERRLRRALRSSAKETFGEALALDEAADAAVRETVRRALEEARRGSTKRPRTLN